MKVRHCRGCSQPIIWTETQAGKRMPVDAKPSSEGTFVLLKASDYFALPAEDETAPIAVHVAKAHVHLTPEQLEGRDRYVPHHATCPDAKSFR
jgi:hypothetical protein